MIEKNKVVCAPLDGGKWRGVDSNRPPQNGPGLKPKKRLIVSRGDAGPFSHAD